MPTDQAARDVARREAPTIPTGPQRVMHGAVGLLALAGLVAQLVLNIRSSLAGGDGAEDLATTLVRFFSYFTILSNALVAVSAIAIARGRPLGTVLRVARLDGVVAIVITAVVHWFLLRPTATATGFASVVDVVLHIAVPALAVLAWLLGPRGDVGGRDVGFAMLFPTLYAAWIFAFGAATGWYPYPFVDVPEVGYGGALTMAAVIFGVFALLLLAAWALDVLGRHLRTTPPSRPRPRADLHGGPQ
ncbi:MAG: Pr6Pr family membrane protein [Brachybacterium sp.]|nr:Pr6Pr family membrane protein [Brachybacterium sp.]